ncbi:MAG: DM13 domain-containing protein [Myxococcota bacterium]
MTTLAGHEARGTVDIATAADGSPVLRISDFWVAPGAPDVRLYVTPDGDVDGPAAVDLGPIASIDGSKDFPLPDGIAVRGLHVVVHCKVFSVEFGRAQLPA